MGDYYIQTGDKKYIPIILPNTGVNKFLSVEHLQVFNDIGIELFTRCGSLHDEPIFSGFKPYRSSNIYCMKDKSILDFSKTTAFDLFLEEMTKYHATIDFWLHPNDLYDDTQFIFFHELVTRLHNKFEKNEIWIATIKEQWERYKQILKISYSLESFSLDNYVIKITNTNDVAIKDVAFDLSNEILPIIQPQIQINNERLVLKKIDAKSNTELNITIK